jgi:hypothetical protein
VGRITTIPRFERLAVTAPDKVSNGDFSLMWIR